MGFFGKLFEKKVCDLCGEEIGLLGNRKLEDGNCCKNCAAKLSPWFSDRKHSTVAEIREQLAYREENKKALASFHPTRKLGNFKKVLIDENAGTFVVSSAEDLEEDNPDIIRADQLLGCEIKVRESRRELYREEEDSEGKIQRRSYSPARYDYSYGFAFKINVDHPYFDEMEFDITNLNIKIDYDEGGFFFRGEGSTVPPSENERRRNIEYARYDDMCHEIKDALDQLREKASAPAAPEAPRQQTAAPAGPAFCPHCGAPAPAGHKFCEHCGGPLT